MLGQLEVLHTIDCVGATKTSLYAGRASLRSAVEGDVGAFSAANCGRIFMFHFSRWRFIASRMLLSWPEIR